MGLLQMSFSGAILILAVIIIRAITINQLPKRTFLILWGVVLFRLLLPFSIPSIFSVYSLVSPNRPVDTFSQTKPDSIGSIMPSKQFTIMDETTPFPSEHTSSISIWFLIWGIGMLFCLTFFIVSYLRSRFEFQTSLPVRNAYVEQWLKDHPFQRSISIRQSDRISTPLTYGFFYPVILMPKKTDWEDKNQLEYILFHEYVHICHYDIVLKLIATFAICIHWFNPIVWIMYFLFNRDIELACDESVVCKFGETSKATYAQMLISMETKKSGLTPFCNNFSKNAVEERITAIMKTKKTSLFAILIAAALIISVSTAFATSAADSTNKTDMVPDTNFTKEEYKKLLALQFDGYEDMTVSEYQNKVWKLRDTTEYKSLLERFCQDQTLYQMKDSNEIASFLFYILEPLTAENWQAREFSSYVKTNYAESPDNATLEFFFTLTIQNPNTLTVREYNAARFAIANKPYTILQDKTAEQLQDDAFMQEIIYTEVEHLTEQWNTNKLQIAVEYFFTPLFLSNQNNTDSEDWQEPRRVPNATEEDYRSLFDLKTPGYQKMSIEDFNMILLDWANEHYDSSDRIFEDMLQNDYQVNLTEEELSFITLSVFLSNEENFRKIQSLKTGRAEEDPSHSYRFFRITDDSLAWCTLECEFSYHITDKATLTIGERDRQISNVINSIQSFWENTSLDDLLKMTESDIIKELKKIAAQYSNDKIGIAINEKGLYFESMDERTLHGN